MYQLTELANGLTVATAELPHMASVSVGLWVGVGGRYETAPLSGVAHFIEHLVFKGTQRRTAREISEAVEGVGGYLNAFTTEELTCFHARAHHRRFPELVDVLADMLLKPKFSPTDIRREREVIKEEIAMYRDQPPQFVHEILHEAIWPDQPLGRPLTGTERTLDGLRRREVLEFFQANYVAQNTLLTVAGPLSHREVLRAFAPYARRFAPGERARFVPALEGPGRPASVWLTRKTEQTQLALGFRTCSRHDPRRHGLRVLNALLGENMSSRLFQTLREDTGLAYSVYSAWASMEDTGALTISAGLDHEDLPRAMKLIRRELRRLMDEPVGRAELRRTRDYLIGQMELNLEGTENQMNWVGESFLGYGKIVDPAEARRRLAGITARQVQAAARDFLRPERLTVAVISPLAKTAALEKSLRW